MAHHMNPALRTKKIYEFKLVIIEDEEIYKLYDTHPSLNDAADMYQVSPGTIFAAIRDRQEFFGSYFSRTAEFVPRLATFI